MSYHGCAILLRKGAFSNYVTQFLQFFDHPPIYSTVLTVILLMTYNSNAIVDRPAALRYL